MTLGVMPLHSLAIWNAYKFATIGSLAICRLRHQNHIGSGNNCA
jgi:hypothetical protein